jgi:hypothetical protein
MGRSYLFYLWQMSLLVVVLFSVEESEYVCAIHGSMVYGLWWLTPLSTIFLRQRDRRSGNLSPFMARCTRYNIM